jgi:DNA-binding transcriptional MerR regulator
MKLMGVNQKNCISTDLFRYYELIGKIPPQTCIERNCIPSDLFRYYELIGHIPPRTRNERRIREYDENDIR